MNTFQVEVSGDTLRLSGLQELVAANSADFRKKSSAALNNGQCNVDVDLSQTIFMDSSGLGALVTLHKLAMGKGGRLRLLHPQPSVQHILELTRMDRVFEVVSP